MLTVTHHHNISTTRSTGQDQKTLAKHCYGVSDCEPMVLYRKGSIVSWDVAHPVCSSLRALHHHVSAQSVLMEPLFFFISSFNLRNKKECMYYMWAGYMPKIITIPVHLLWKPHR